MRRALAAFVAGLIVMAGAGYWWTHRQSQPGAFPNGEVVDGIRSLNRLVVFQAYLTAITDVQECPLILVCMIRSTQTLITPAYVNYYVDFDAMSDRLLSLRNKELTVRLPPLMIERPNVDTTAVRIFDGGMWSAVTGASRRLEQQSRPLAVKQLRQRANMPFLVRAARHQALKAVLANVRGVLRAAGRTDIGVTVTF